MAERPYFYIEDEKEIRKKTVEFKWYPGFAVSQKQKSIASMHDEIRKRAGLVPLEVSTKSEIPLGRKLSAFQLMLDGHYLECIFQSSKVFFQGGPFEDILEMNPKDAKRDERLKKSGRLKAFRYQGEDWPLEPKTAFYDYIYYNAVRQSLTEKELQELAEYQAFTDIEFNPEKSLNTQARGVAFVKLLYNREKGLRALSKNEFLELHRRYVR